MAVFTDSPRFADGLLGLSEAGWRRSGSAGSGPAAPGYVSAFLEDTWRLDRPGAGAFPDVVVTEVAGSSNYDRLIDLVRGGAGLPSPLICLAGSGAGFHGFKGRAWAAVPGNVHLSVHLAPRRPIERFEVAFMALAAVSVVDAIDRLPGLADRPGIRWVNDVVIDGAKAGGVLAYTHAQGTVVNAAVLGIGVNVGTRPPVEPTPFVPAVTALAEHVEGAGPPPGLLPSFLSLLLDALDRNYRLLLDAGYRPLVDRYRARSVVVGRRIEVCAEDSDAEPRVLTRGVVRSIGEGLELHLEDRERPVTRGRIIVVDPGAAPPR